MPFFLQFRNTPSRSSTLIPCAFEIQDNIKKAIDILLDNSKNAISDNKSGIVDYQQYAVGNYGIFSITVRADNITLDSLTNNEKVKLVDIHYNQEAERVAKDNNTKVKYITLSEKPDNTR